MGKTSLVLDVVDVQEGGGGGWSQIKPTTFGNELRTYDMTPYRYSVQSWQFDHSIRSFEGKSIL